MHLVLWSNNSINQTCSYTHIIMSNWFNGWKGKTHFFLLLSSTFPLGHWQRGTHCSVQMGLGLVQVGGQAEPQRLNCWPSTGHPECVYGKEKYNACCTLITHCYIVYAHEYTSLKQRNGRIFQSVLMYMKLFSTHPIEPNIRFQSILCKTGGEQPVKFEILCIHPRDSFTTWHTLYIPYSRKFTLF